MKAADNTISLVLGSGGARGLAHIGVIQWLKENGYQVRSISGASMGALIGGIYAAGKLDAYAKWVRALEKADVVGLLDFSFGRAGIFKGERVIRVLKELIGDFKIEDLPISFTAVATDVDSAREVWLSKGSLFHAIRASIAIPMIFRPVEHEGRMLVDGALVNPIPIAPTLKDLTGMTIAVNVSARAEGPPALASKKLDKWEGKKANQNSYHRRIVKFIEEIQQKLNPDETRDLGLFDVVSQSYDAMQNTIARFQLAAYSPNKVIDIPRNACAFYEFDRADELISMGYDRARKVMGDPKPGKEE
ncbi:MAG: patatin-like phospholipase family protein [bacterium]|nr:patatin-like phospholipase family protein [bacterium]